MINLLPEKEKKELESGKGRKIILVLGIFCLFFLVCLILFLFLFRIYFFSQINSQKEALFDKEKELSIPEFQEFKQTIKETNQELVKVKNFYQNQILITPILKELSELVPPKVYFTRLFIQKPEIFEKEKDYLFKINIWGYAESRENLFLFQKALRENDDFKEVDVSLQSWLEPTDVDFNLTIEIQ